MAVGRDAINRVSTEWGIGDERQKRQTYFDFAMQK